MVRIFSPLAFLFGMSLVIAGQTDAKPSCPTIKVIGPAGITNPGGLISFKGKIAPFDREKFTVVWNIDSPNIKDLAIETGQGTLEIGVRTPKTPSYNITATLAVKGLPDGCVMSASETAGVAGCILPLVADEYGKLRISDERARLDNLAIQLTSESDTIALYVFRYPSIMSRSAIESINARILKHLSKMRGIAASRIRFAYETGDTSITRVYLLPIGADWQGTEVDLDTFRPKKLGKGHK
jgi:hypothetical protein